MESIDTVDWMEDKKPGRTDTSQCWHAPTCCSEKYKPQPQRFQ